VLAPTSPRIAVYGTLNKPGLTASAAGGWTPPDSTGAIGTTHYVEMANSSVAVYNRSLGFVSSATLNAFTGQTGSLCDPQIQWDDSAQRWIYAVLYCNVNSSVQHLLVGWSKTSDPSTLSSVGWCHFVVLNDPLLMDYPKLGHNSKYLIVGGNLYNESTPTPNPPFVSAGILWMPLPALNSDTSCTLPSSVSRNTLPLLNGDGVSYTFTPVPVNTASNASNGYILSAYDPAGNAGQAPGPRAKMAVWHLDAAGLLWLDNDVAVNSYDVPSSAPQLGSPQVIDTQDARLTQAVGDPTAGFYTQHTVAGPGGRSQVDWYQFTVSGSTVVLAQQGSAASSTDWVFNAAISPRFDGQGAAIVYNRSSATILPLIAARIRLQSTATGMWEPGELVLATSAAADGDRTCNVPPGLPCRWGDYAAATPDPVQANLVWGTSEFNTAVGTTPAWSNQNFALWVSVAPSNVMAAAGDASAMVSWSAPPVESVGPIGYFAVKAYSGSTVVATMLTTGSTTSAIFKGLTNGTTYTFTVTANGTIGPSPESLASNAVTATRAVAASTSTPPPRDPAMQSGSAPSPSPR
jgi:hypothetical protein